MTQVDDLSRSLVTFNQNGTVVAVLDMSSQLGWRPELFLVSNDGL